MLTCVDGTADPYKEERLEDGSFNPGLFCKKMNGPALNYEIVIGLYTGKVCSVKGPYRNGNWPDLKIAKEKRLVGMLRRTNEKCIADGTYRNAVFINSQHGLPRPMLFDSKSKGTAGDIQWKNETFQHFQNVEGIPS